MQAAESPDLFPALEPGEELRSIKGYPSYLASNQGRVWSIQTSIWLRAPTDRYGYSQVTLCREGQRKIFRIHRLVALAFLGDPPTPQHEVAHKDGNPSHNQIENLRWASRVENWADKWIHGTDTSGERNGQAKLSPEQVREIRDLYAKGAYSQRGLGRKFSISQRQIFDIVNNRSWVEPD